MKFTFAFLMTLALCPLAQGRTLVVDGGKAEASDSGPATDSQPLKTIHRAAELVQAGDVVQIRAGVYREKVVIKASGTRSEPIRFQAAPDAQVVITGADVLSGWTKDGDNSYSVPWPYKQYQGDEHNPRGVEQVFVGGKLYRKVPSLPELADGTFFVDLAAKRLHLFSAGSPDGNNSAAVEASVRGAIWTVSGAYVQTRGLVFRYAATHAQQGMVRFGGAGDVAEDCTFEWSNSTGASFLAEDITARNCTFQDNGQQGYSGNHAHRLHFDGCTVQRNNNKEFPRGWEAGGNKICMSRDVVYENSRFLNNHGSGVWFDISNEGAAIHNCLIADNEDAGIFYEISYGLHVYDNVIVGNGRLPSKGSWGANGGVCVSSSPGCVIERNLIVGNNQGFCFREQIRTTTPTDGSKGEVPVWVHDEIIRNNLIAGNPKGQVQGWFDIAGERYWPKAMQTGKVETAKPGSDLAAGYQAKKDGVPPGLSLEDLKISFQGNFYAMEPKQVFFVWGANWKHKKEYKDLPSLTKALGFEDRGQIISPLAVDIAKRDFRLPKDHPAFAAGAYPKGPVPDCTLGTR